MYLKIKKENPFDARAYWSLAAAYANENKLRAAELCYRKALWFTPHEPALLNELGCIYFKRKKYPAAKKLFIIALSLSPQLTSARNNLKKTEQMIQLPPSKSPPAPLDTFAAQTLDERLKIFNIAW